MARTDRLAHCWLGNDCLGLDKLNKPKSIVKDHSSRAANRFKNRFELASGVQLSVNSFNSLTKQKQKLEA